MTQQKLSLFQSLNSSPSRAVGMEEIVRLIRYDSDVENKTEDYRRMATILGKKKADEEVKQRLMPACSVTAQSNIKGVYLRSRTTGKFTREEITKKANLRELTNYHVDKNQQQEQQGQEGGEG